MKRYLIISIVTAVFFASCSDYLDIAPPNSITDDQIREILAEGDSAKIVVILGGMADNLPARFHFENKAAPSSDGRYNSSPVMDVMRNLEGNDIAFGEVSLTGNWGYDEYNLNDFISQKVDKNTYYWKGYWDNITTANKLLFFLDDATMGNSKVMKEYKARALTLRAYSYNHLMENYQDAYLSGGKAKLGLMLYDSYSPTQDNKARASAVETYTFIVKDIKDAINLFAEAGAVSTDETTDIDVDVANFILARIALCVGEWTTTISACDAVLAKYQTLMAENTYVARRTADGRYLASNNGFLDISKNPEVILGWSAENSMKGHNSWMNIFGNSYGGASEFSYQRIDDQLYNKIADDDYRKDNFPATAYGDFAYQGGAVGNIPAYANFKFACTHGIGFSADDRKANNVADYYMRASEVYLMKAEAQAQSGDEAGAKETLNILLSARSKAGASLTCDNYPAMDGITALQMVQLQTRIEMWGEGGREYYNNKRWNIAVDRTKSNNHTSKLTYPVSGMTLQIPEDEMINNPLCVQN